MTRFKLPSDAILCGATACKMRGWMSQQEQITLAPSLRSDKKSSKGGTGAKRAATHFTATAQSAHSFADLFARSGAAFRLVHASIACKLF